MSAVLITAATGTVDAPALDAPEAELRHGYTLAQLHELATRAVRIHRYHQRVDFTERWDIAWPAIAEVLYANAEPPTPHELIRAAWAAIGDERAGRTRPTPPPAHPPRRHQLCTGIRRPRRAPLRDADGITRPRPPDRTT
jgi:hypothetical protein